MKYTLKYYVDSLFEGVPDSMAARELHEEILSNLEARYEDCINGGMSPQRAYAAVIGTVGDVSGLIAQLSGGGMHVSGNYRKTSRLGDLLGKYSYIFTEENIRTLKRSAIAIVLIAAAAIATFMICFDVKIRLVVSFPVLFASIIVISLVHMAWNIAKFSREGDNKVSRRKILKTVKNTVTLILWLCTFSFFFMIKVAGNDTFGIGIIFAAAIAQIIINAVFKIQLSRYRERSAVPAGDPQSIR